MRYSHLLQTRYVVGLLLSLVSACASTPAPKANTADTAVEAKPAPQPETPPASGPTPELQFPVVRRSTTKGGLEVNAVDLEQLPIVDLKLVIRSGSASDPKSMPGTAQLVAAMLKEGTKQRTSAEIAEQVDFLGAQLWIDNDQENIYIQMRALAEHMEAAMDLIADLAMRPAFSARELDKLKKREIDRLALSQKDPNFLAAREFFQRLYGDHPYAHFDTTQEVVRRMTTAHLKAFHKQHFLVNNALLVVAGSAQPEAVTAAAAKSFRGFRKGKVVEPDYPSPPVRQGREIVVVDRPESVQSVIYVGNLALARTSPDYLPLLLANQVLGGSAAARLFMDLRERQSLTYGAYSRVYESVGVAPFQAYAAVRNEVTQQAMSAFMKHLQQIRSDEVPEPELQDAKRLLVDKLPLRLDTSAKIVELVSDLRVYGLADDYWEHFRENIEGVTAEQALAAAQQYIQADDALIVVVGKAAAVNGALAEYGPVTVVDPAGNPIASEESAEPAETNEVEATAAEASSKTAAQAAAKASSTTGAN